MQITKPMPFRLIREAHRKAISELAEKDSVTFAKGLLLNPELIAGVSDVEEVFSILLKKGEREVLTALLRLTKLPKGVKSILATVLLLG